MEKSKMTKNSEKPGAAHTSDDTHPVMVIALKRLSSLLFTLCRQV